ncbi:MAG: 30S ribosomal protein S20 [Patescibacteria group bacterium]|nr:30S ribosomal protein S20 [Patescibacteria group bacterium]
MPIIKSAIKQMKQNRKKRAQRLPYKTRMKTSVKMVLELSKEGKSDEAKKALREAYSLIDTACKKHILPPNTAARRKSRLANAVNDLGKKSA